MKKHIYNILAFLLFVSGMIYLVGHISSWVGWYGYEKWKNRKYSNSINESKHRGVFVKELNFKIENTSGRVFPFEVFIEKAYKYGRHTSEETVVETHSSFPFQISFPYRPNDSISVRVKEDYPMQFDSAGYSLKQPRLPDTILLEILGQDSGVIKVW